MSSLEIYAALCVVFFVSAVVAGFLSLRWTLAPEYKHLDSTQRRQVAADRAIKLSAITYSWAVLLSSACILIYGAIQ